MKTMTKIVKSRLFAIAAAAVLGLGMLAFAGEAQAQYGRYSNSYGNHSSHNHSGHYNSGSSRSYYGNRGRAPIYHPPSVHYDQQYHVESYHWTPGRGLHTHGHYDAVPHYVPGHFDTLHNGHIDLNPHYHGR